jgi:hypothetical protein
MKSTNAVKSIGALALMLALATSLALAGNPNPRVLPIHSSPYGMTYGQWSGQWWQWAYTYPLAASPVTDPTGELAALGQSGPVWFLAGTFGDANAERTVTIPAGKALFFPIIDTVWVNLPELGDYPWSEEQEIAARAAIAPFINDAYDLSCQIDGVEVVNLADYRCQTPDGGEYMVALPADNVFAPYGLTEPGIYGPCVDDGIYLMLAPLAPGIHTIQFSAQSFWYGNPWALEVTYHLTVLK